MMHVVIIVPVRKAEWITDRTYDRTESTMSTLPTLEPMVPPRWLRKHRQAQRLRVRFNVPEGETIRRLGPGFYLASHNRKLAEIAREQRVRPFDPARHTWADDLTEAEWDSFQESIREAQGRPPS